MLGTHPSPAATGDLAVAGELKQWHKVTLELAGPAAAETGGPVNPFTDYRIDAVFTHASGGPSYRVPGYFAADGRAADTGATAGGMWRVHFTPPKTGRWTYRIEFMQGRDVATGARGEPLAPFHGREGGFEIASSDKAGPDFRAHGWLEYVGRHHLRFAGSGEYFLKAGPDSPETLLAYADFDATTAAKRDAPVLTWTPHVKDWRPGDPSWGGGRGRGLIGAINYLASESLNTLSFLPYNVGGDGDNVWPFVSRDDKERFDCSKLDQWAIVFDHAQRHGIHLNFKLQENEMDDNRIGPAREVRPVPASLDHGGLGRERKLYLRELIARFGHALGITWNLGEENTQTTDEQRAMARFIRETHYYPSNIVLHTFLNEHESTYNPLLGDAALTGVSMQNDWAETHLWTVKWVRASAAAGRPWVVANDEQGHWAYGVPPDPGYAGFDGIAPDPRRRYTLHDVRKLTLWGNLLGGGAGVEYYFGYRLPQHDLGADDFRSRDRSWDYCRIALGFFRDQKIPFWTMQPADERMGNSIGAEPYWCLARPGEVYLVYLPWGGVSTIDLRDASGEFSVEWFNPRSGGTPRSGAVKTVRGGVRARLGVPPEDEEEDWLVLLRAAKP